MTSLPVPVNILSDPAFAKSSAPQTGHVATPVTSLGPTLEPPCNGQRAKTLETPPQKKGILLREPPLIDMVKSKDNFDAYSTDALRKFCKMHNATLITKTHTKEQLKELAWSLCDSREKEGGGSSGEQRNTGAKASPSSDSDDRVIVLRYP